MAVTATITDGRGPGVGLGRCGLAVGGMRPTNQHASHRPKSRPTVGTMSCSGRNWNIYTTATSRK